MLGTLDVNKICMPPPYAAILLTLPYLACHAKKYSNAPSGWPTRQKLTQNTELPMILVVGSSLRSNGRVNVMSGSCSIMPANATPVLVVRSLIKVYFKTSVRSRRAKRRTDEIVSGNSH